MNTTDRTKDPETYLRAARCPPILQPQEFGLWEIQRRECPAEERAAGMFRLLVGASHQVALCRMTEATMHLPSGEVVMEDSLLELRRHLPIWLAARGRVLVTGLGLGCVVRGLLASPHVSHIDVIEIDPGIVRVVGPEFAQQPRVTLHQADAFTWPIPEGAHWDIAWHDIWCEGSGLQLLHVKLMARFGDYCDAQGAWMLPRMVKRLNTRWRLVG